MHDSRNLQKYASANPVLRRLIARFQARCGALLEGCSVTSALEVGCGEGFLIEALKARYPAWSWAGCDLDAGAVADARRRLPGVPLAVEDIYRLGHDDSAFDLVIASEVLEHLDDPAAGLAELVRVARHRLLLTVPDEPRFQLSNFLRGKYLATWGNHPEHVQHWGFAGFRAFVAEQAKVRVAVRSYPWLLVLADKRG